MVKTSNYTPMKEPLYWIGLCNGGISLKTFTHECGCSIKTEDGTPRFITRSKLKLDELGKQSGKYIYTMYSHSPISIEGFLKLCLEEQGMLLAKKNEEVQKIKNMVTLIKENIVNPTFIDQPIIKPTRVYTVISRWVYDTGESGMNFLGTFTDKEKALECFEQAKTDARTDFNNGAVNCEEDSKEEIHKFNDYTEFEIYEDGNFNYNHIVVTLKEEPIK